MPTEPELLEACLKRFRVLHQADWQEAWGDQLAEQHTTHQHLETQATEVLAKIRHHAKKARGVFVELQKLGDGRHPVFAEYPVIDIRPLSRLEIFVQVYEAQLAHVMRPAKVGAKPDFRRYMAMRLCLARYRKTTLPARLIRPFLKAFPKPSQMATISILCHKYSKVKYSQCDTVGDVVDQERTKFKPILASAAKVFKDWE